ncbi:MAG: excinuclease ABC subunit UvrA, partial [Candidatus Paceibacteria bacterium]
PNCGQPVGKQTPTQITDQILALRKTNPGKQLMILAPIIEGKKGEHKGLMEEILRAGFPYARFDGIVWRLEELLDKAIDKKRKHTLEVVVDRLILDKTLERQRIAEDVEQALKMGKGIMKITLGKSSPAHPGLETKINKQTKFSELIYSERFSCTKCGLNLPDVEPRLFSFNNPYGACPTCTGLGSLIRVDPELVIPNKSLTLAEGAIRPWMTASHRVGRQSWYWWMLQELADKYNFSLNTPVKNLPKKIIDIILYGDKSGPLKLQDEDWEGQTRFEGVIPNLERRWRETDSEFTRQEIEKYMVKQVCPTCKGKRLKHEALSVLIDGKNITEIVDMTIEDAHKFFSDWHPKSLNEKRISQPLVKEILKRLQFMLQVGLDYLTLSRESTTLAGGEAQRIRLATQIGSGLSGVIYVLDEPSIGLHARDLWRLIQTLKSLRDLGNTVLVVEHDEQTIRNADWLLDIGPGAGEHGGRIVFEGPPSKIKQAKTLTGEYIAGKKKVVLLSGKNNSGNEKYLELVGAQEHNLKNINVKIPLGKLVCVTGVSGSGKSTLITDTLGPALLRHFYQARVVPGKFKEIRGLENIDKVVIVDQSPIGRTPRSNPATYTGAFSYIRDLFSKTQLAKMRGYGPGRFSFNVKGGRCEVCEGQGWKKIEMFFLPDVYVECEECKGSRYNKEALEVEYRGKNIAQILEMSIQDALKFFQNVPGLREKLKTLNDVGLGYMKLGQPAPTLSGGEAQRVKLATELSRRATGKTFYILDEPTTGLHFDDIRKLLGVLRALVDKGNTVLVIEHELHVIASADWIIDLGPEGGQKGGQIVAEGTPEAITKEKKSYTGQFLKKILLTA